VVINQKKTKKLNKKKKKKKTPEQGTQALLLYSGVSCEVSERAPKSPQWSFDPDLFQNVFQIPYTLRTLYRHIIRIST